MEVIRDQLNEYNSKYGKLINICVNNRLERDHQVYQHGYSQIEHCVTNDPLVVRSEFGMSSDTIVAR